MPANPHLIPKNDDSPPLRGRALLISETPLQVIPSLAEAIGLNEAIFLQQLHYWLLTKSGIRDDDGRRWIYNTYDQWQEQFPFWSTRTIMRIVSNLEDMELVETTSVFNEWKADRTKWYTIDYEVLEDLA